MSDAAAVLFDLDGTLIDSLEDIADSANRALAREGFPVHPVADYKHFVGDGMIVLMERILPPGHRDEATIQRLVAIYRDSYATGWNVKTRLYEGIPELLDAIVARGLPMGVVSNKPDDFTRLCAVEYLSRWPFAAIVGQRADLPRKPDPAMARHAAQTLGVDPARCVFVGDTSTDMKTARAAGMIAVGVTWGFRDEAELRGAGATVVIHRADELSAVLGS